MPFAGGEDQYNSREITISVRNILCGRARSDLWLLWEREIKHALTGPVFRREWEGISAEFANNRDFFRYISTLIHSKRQIAVPTSALPNGY